MNDDLYQLKIGEDIYQVDYSHSSGKFTQKEKIEKKKNIIICGLHTLYQDNMNRLLDIKIYIDTDRKLIKKWKIRRDVTERGYNLEKVLKQIDKREEDYYKYIIDQKNKADIIINFYEENELKCDLIIQNNYFKNIIIDKLLKYKYKISYLNERLIINLKNNNLYEDVNFKKIIKKNEELFINDFYYEILFIIYLLHFDD